ncbi:SH3-like domain-containing protein [Desulfobotulus alkaliphilus]|uniref:SH3-like domain-containing protein n=1 Tax=Desulfobotulus alkaliphilus TaxID=622671 RepID=A0A562RYG2_9BACT|nr:SH3 domain-containing protein [Desulfobotulus alkaliphilus]TWI74127.1 SH3-like domain-containing protein [Desulfobotulus alkaliphilus]
MAQTAKKQRSSGWMLAGFAAVLFWVLMSSAAAAAERLTVERPTLNVRSGPGTQYSVLWQAEANYPIEVLERKDGWVRFRDFEGYEGWVSGRLVGRTPSVVVKNPRANVRSGPGTNHSIVFTVEKGVPFRVLGRQGDWIQIRHADGDEGWIHGNLVW